MSDGSIPLSWPLVLGIVSTFWFGAFAGYEAINLIRGRRGRDVLSTIAAARQRLDDIDGQIVRLASTVLETQGPSGADVTVLRNALDVRRSAVRDVSRTIASL